MLSRSLPAKLSASYLHGFLSVQHAVSLPPSEAFRKLGGEALPKLFARFPVRPACYLAPSQRSSPQAICTVSSPSSMLSRSLPAKLSASYLHGFLSVQHAVSLPAKLSASYLHGFLSVQHAVSLPPSEALPKLFARFPVRPACCLTPSQRSFPHAICTSPSFLASFLPPFLPSLPLPPFLPSSLPSFSSPSSLPPSLPSFFPSFLLFPILLSFLPISVPSPSNTPYHSLATKCLNENPGIGDAFGKNEYGRNMTQQRNCSFVNWKV